MRSKFPPIAPTQYVVLQVEARTGVLLTVDGNRFLGRGDCYHIFDALEAARAFSKRVVAFDREVECVIQDSAKKVVETVRAADLTSNDWAT